MYVRIVYYFSLAILLVSVGSIAEIDVYETPPADIVEPSSSGISGYDTLDILIALEFADADVDVSELIEAFENCDERSSFVEGALGRAKVIDGINKPFIMMKMYGEYKGLSVLSSAYVNEPDNPFVLMWLGASAVDTAYTYIGKGVAATYLSEAARLHTESDNVHRKYGMAFCCYYLGVLYKDNRELRRALNYWELCIEIAPQSTIAERASFMLKLFTG